MNFKKEEVFTESPYTLLYLFNVHKKYIKCLSFSSMFDFLEFNDFANEINRHVNEDYEENL